MMFSMHKFLFLFP